MSAEMWLRGMAQERQIRELQQQVTDAATSAKAMAAVKPVLHVSTGESSSQSQATAAKLVACKAKAETLQAQVLQAHSANMRMGTLLIQVPLWHTTINLFNRFQFTFWFE